MVDGMSADAKAMIGSIVAYHSLERRYIPFTASILRVAPLRVRALNVMRP
jgi:hypothetical protein